MFKQSAISVSLVLGTTFLFNTAFAQSEKNDPMIEVKASDFQALKAQIEMLTKKVDRLEKRENEQENGTIKTDQANLRHTDSENIHQHRIAHSSTDQSEPSPQVEELPERPQPLFRGKHVYIESDAEYDDTLLEQLSSSQVPLGTLKLQDRFHQPSFIIGGSLEADLQGWWGDQIVNANNRDIYGNGIGVSLNTANIDLLTNLNSWVQGYITIAGAENFIDIQNGFVNFGNLKRFPFFVSIGKNRPPLGSFGGGGVWASSIGTMIFRPTQVTNVTLGYHHDGLTTYLAGWRYNDNTNSKSVNEYNFIYSAFYSGNITKKLAYGVNGGYMNNIIGSGAGNSSLNDINGELSTQRNPVLDFEGLLTYENYGVYAGITSTLFKRNYTNYQRAGTWYIQGAYTSNIYDMPTTFSIGYNGAYHTQNFTGNVNGDAINNIPVTGPKEEFITYIQSEVFTNIYLALEYSWLQTYNNGKGNAITGDATVYF